MKTKLKMIYWKGEKFWVGKLLEHPEIMTQGETLAELEENMKEAYMLMTMEDVPEKHKVKSYPSRYEEESPRQKNHGRRLCFRETRT